jgi:hypothetical protein
MQESKPTRLGTQTQQNNKIQSMDSPSHIEVENMQEVSTSCLDIASAGCKISEQLSQAVFSEPFLCLPKVGKLGMRALVVAAGSEHSAAVFEDGEVMVWGWAEHGQLGLSTTEDQNIPQRVVLGRKGLPSDPCSMVGSQTNDGINIQTLIQCGSGFTFLLRIPCSSEYPNSSNQG